jgi:hypothetical protein
MIEYKYKKIKGYEEKKFTENGHTMFETDVLRRLQRLAHLEEQIKQGELLPKHDVSKSFYSDDAIARLKTEYFEKGLKANT